MDSDILEIVIPLRTALVWLLAAALLMGAAGSDLAVACLGAPGAWVDAPLTVVGLPQGDAPRRPASPDAPRVRLSRAPPASVL